MGSVAGVVRIEITFPCAVELPEGFERALDGLVNMVCEKYEREHPTEVMWCAGHGSKPTFSQRDAAFLGEPTDANAPETGEPTFDDSVFQISVACREDYGGQNPHNPERARLQAEAAEARRRGR